MRVLLTGATGFLGSEIARQLVAAGHEVRTLVRRTSKLDALDGLEVERVEGDILDAASVARALGGRDALIHTAAQVGFRPRDREKIMKANIEGTRTVLLAALEKKVKRVVYTSSVAAVGASRERKLLDETSTWDVGGVGPWYVDSKKYAEDVAFELAKKGLPVVILNPAMIYGPRDLQVNSTRPVVEYVKGRMRVYVAGGGASCDVRDVAAAHVAALERGTPGERYILGGQNFSYGEFFDVAARLTGLGRARRIPYALAWLLGLGMELVARVRPHDLEEMSRPLVRFMALHQAFDIAKASRDLGYTTRPLEETLRDTIRDHVKRGVIPATTPELKALLAVSEVAPQLAGATA